MGKNIRNSKKNNHSVPSQHHGISKSVLSSNLFANSGNKSKGGRPPKSSIPGDYPKYKLDEILKKPPKVQEYDEFSKLPQLFLTYGCAGDSMHRFKNYMIDPRHNSSQNGSRLIYSSLKNDKLILRTFLTTIIERTGQVIGLNEHIVDLLIEMANTFSGVVGPNFLEKTKNYFMGNALKLDHVYYFMDFFLFDQIIEIFEEWKKVLFDKIVAI